MLSSPCLAISAQDLYLCVVNMALITLPFYEDCETRKCQMLSITSTCHNRESKSNETGLSLLKKYHRFAGGKVFSKVPNISCSFSKKSIQVLAP